MGRHLAPVVGHLTGGRGLELEGIRLRLEEVLELVAIRFLTKGPRMIRHLLNASVDVYRPTFTADGRGGRSRSMAKVATIRARISQPSAAERAIAAQLGAVLEHVVHVEHVADVERGDELDTGGPRRLRVQAVVEDSSLTYRRLDCQVVEGA